MSTNPPQLPVTVAISGAAGRVGYSLLFRIAYGAMFGTDQSVALRLLEHASKMSRLQAIALELKDCTYPLLDSVTVSDDPHEAFAGADWILLVAGSPRDIPSPARHELLKRNGAIYVEHGRMINAAAPAARIVVIGAPCNANCMIAMAHAADVPREHWIAMNRLDAMRAAAFIAEKAAVPVAQVNRVTIWGNHGEQVYADAHNAFIGDTPAWQVIRDPAWMQEALQAHVRGRSAEIFRLHSASPAATAAQAILGTVRSLSTPTPPGHYFSAAVASDGSYGVPKGLVFGFPLRTDDGHMWSIAQELYLDEFAESQIAANIEQIEQEAVLAERWFG
ncbi:MAG TPA: malate dehydrogenase [Pirellulales bacterium]|jgi:malate dehydrogenase|nr:malate dehydrogenase [Pirellulales bacterium]